MKGGEGREVNRGWQAVQETDVATDTQVRERVNSETWDRNNQLIKMGEANIKGWHRDVS